MEAETTPAVPTTTRKVFLLVHGQKLFDEFDLDAETADIKNYMREKHQLSGGGLVMKSPASSIAVTSSKLKELEGDKEYWFEGYVENVLATEKSSNHLQQQNAQLTNISDGIMEIRSALPVLCELAIDKNNFWNGSEVSSVRSSSFRSRLQASVANGEIRCMVTGILCEPGTDDVIAAHIIPVRTKLRLLRYIGLTANDINDSRNGLFLCYAIEKAFDNLQLSFIKSNPLRDALFMKIWDKSICQTPVYVGSKHTIGEYNHAELNLNGHQVFKRALSYQAYMAYNNCTIRPGRMPEEYGEANDSPYYISRQIMKTRFLKDVKEDNEEAEGEAAGNSGTEEDTDSNECVGDEGRGSGGGGMLSPPPPTSIQPFHYQQKQQHKQLQQQQSLPQPPLRQPRKPAAGRINRHNRQPTVPRNARAIAAIEANSDDDLRSHGSNRSGSYYSDDADGEGNGANDVDDAGGAFDVLGDLEEDDVDGGNNEIYTGLDYGGYNRGQRRWKGRSKRNH